METRRCSESVVPFERSTQGLILIGDGNPSCKAGPEHGRQVDTGSNPHRGWKHLRNLRQIAENSQSTQGIILIGEGNSIFSLWCARILHKGLWKTVSLRNRAERAELNWAVRHGVDTGSNPHRGWKHKVEAARSSPCNVDTGPNSHRGWKQVIHPSKRRLVTLSTQGLILVSVSSGTTER